LKEYQEIHQIQYLPFKALHFFPQLSDEGVILNSQVLDILEQVTEREDETHLKGFTKLVFMAKLKDRKIEIGPEASNR
jgi:hypothetical protein